MQIAFGRVRRKTEPTGLPRQNIYTPRIYQTLDESLKLIEVETFNCR